MSTIQKIHARQILDSRGNPTLEVDVLTKNNAMGSAAVPSGASTGQYEATELRDGDLKYYLGKKKKKAIQHVNNNIAQAIVNRSVFAQREIDQCMIALDGTANKSKLGANALLGVSLAVAKAAAAEKRLPLYRYLGGVNAHTLPIPMMNILNGGVHADNDIDFQEFMIMPHNAACFSEALRMGVETFHCLGNILSEKGLSKNVGDEGGFAPNISSNEAAIELVLKAIEKAGYRPGEDISIALDAASSEFYEPKSALYHFKKSNGKSFTAPALVGFWESWVKKYPIISIEDGMAENDWDGWCQLTQRIGKATQLVGDDLFVTHAYRLQQGISKKAANAVLIKVNQVGTLSETIDTIQLAKKNNYLCVMSHRSGETEDTTLADLAVALHTPQIKTGATARSERVAKYNQLLRIEEALGPNACFASIAL